MSFDMSVLQIPMYLTANEQQEAVQKCIKRTQGQKNLRIIKLFIFCICFEGNKCFFIHKINEQLNQLNNFEIVQPVKHFNELRRNFKLAWTP